MSKPQLVFPSDEQVSAAVQMIHDGPARFWLTVTGGFAGLQGLLWDTAGAARTLIGAGMPYEFSATEACLGRAIEKYCSPVVAHDLALASYEKAKWFAAKSGLTGPVYGLGATAKFATDRTLKGGCAAYVALYGDEGAVQILCPTEVFASPGFGRLTRREQGEYADLFALNQMLGLLALPTLELPELDPTPRKNWTPWTILQPDGQHLPASALDPSKYLFYPGSFNPWHEGHRNAARAAAEQTGKTVVYMMDGQNPDKPGVTDADISSRLRQFGWQEHVIVTEGTGLFVDKARRFPGFGFIVGADTMRRICLSKYYESDAMDATRRMHQVFSELIRLGTRFYVLDRFEDGRLLTLPEIDMPDAMRAICQHVPGRWDISSTELRARTAT